MKAPETVKAEADEPEAVKINMVADQPPPYKRYLITTTSPIYTGQVFGIQITNGVGILDAAAVDHKLGHTLDRIVAELRSRPGYHVKEIGGSDPIALVNDIRKKQSEQAAKETELLTLLADAAVAEKVREVLAEGASVR